MFEAINPLEDDAEAGEAGGQGGWGGGVHHEVKIPAVRQAWRMDDHAEGSGGGSEEGSGSGEGSGGGGEESGAAFYGTV